MSNMSIFITIFIVFGILFITIVVWSLVNINKILFPSEKIVLLSYASQNFGTVDSKKIVLGKNNEELHNYIINSDIFAFQELLIPVSRWNNGAILGDIESFGFRLNERFGYFIAVACNSAEENSIKCFKAYGLYINPNFNFKIKSKKQIILTTNSDYDEDDDDDSDDCNAFPPNNTKNSNLAEFKGIAVVVGKLYDLYKTAICSVHLIWDNKVGYKNPKNDELITKLFKYLKYRRVEKFIIVGDFNISFSHFKNNSLVEWRKLLPKIKIHSEVDNIKSSLVTCFDQDGFAHPDHIVSSFKIASFNTQIIGRTDHARIFGELEIPIPSNFSAILLNNHGITIPENNR